MQNLLEQLKKVLAEDERLVSEGEILKNKVIELGIKLDAGLLKLLLADKQMKKAFFEKVGPVKSAKADNGASETLIFDKDKFIKFVSNKQFLPDSYTAFKNKIGLTEDDEFIREKKEVVLSWPYKDCVLEGGMTKEDQKRNEVFWNQTLAPDEISRLLDPKVFTNAKRVDKKGEHKFDKFKTDENGDPEGKQTSYGASIKDNLIIKGNNLLALHSLKKRFAGKVKLIYIDPPYNTGGSEETFTYNNNFNHSTWLTFMKSRLEIAKIFLRDDGFIAITIDHNELFYIGTLSDEIFGRNNRIGVISIVHKPEGRNQEKFFGTSNEFMLVYARNKEMASFGKVILDSELKERFDKDDERGKFRLKNFIRLTDGKYSLRENKPHFYYPIYVSRDLKKFSIAPKDNCYEVFPITDKGVERTWKTTKETFLKLAESGEIVAQKENEGVILYEKLREDQVVKTHWIDKKYHAYHFGTKLLENILGRKEFSFPKSLYAVLDTLKIMTSEDDIILDFFAGSGTTGHAVLELNKEDGGNRRFILCEQLEEHIKVCTERIQKVVKSMGTSDDFVYTELAKWNENFVDEIKKAKSGKELQKLWETLKEKAYLSYKVDIAAFDKAAKEFADLSLKDQKRFLLETLDQNHLYINYSEIDDKEYSVSPEDKKLNKEFYGK